MLKFSAQVKAHSEDVKAISVAQTASGDVFVASCSRDGCVKVWQLIDNLAFISIAEHQEHSGFVNAVASFIRDDAKLSDESTSGLLVASGGMDSLVNLFDVTSKCIVGTLIGHEANVCHLEYFSDGRLLSCAWDKTCRIWNGTSLEFLMNGHSECIWAGCFVSHDHVLTASADKSINLWHNGELVKSFLGHQDVARSVCILSDDFSQLGDFVSVGNDGCLMIWSLGSIHCQFKIDAHDSFIYSVKCHGDVIATAGEDRCIKLWKRNQNANAIEPLICEQSIAIPAVSIWSLDFDASGNLYCACSDGFIYCFVGDDRIVVDESELQAFQERLMSMEISKDVLGDVTCESDVLQNPGKRVGQVVVVKNGSSGASEAHQWDGSAWCKVGDVVDGSGGNSAKTLYLGQEYDYLFDVEVESGVSFKLPFNNGDNPYAAATKFLADNDLSPNMVDQVVEFLLKNTQTKSITREPPQLFDPYSLPKQPRIESRNSVGPLLEFQTFTAFNAEGMVKKLLEFSDQEDHVKISKEYAALLSSALTKSNALESIDPLVDAVENWSFDHLFPIFDALRVLVLNNCPVEHKTRMLTAASNRLDDFSNCAPAILTLLRLVTNLISCNDAALIVLQNSALLTRLLASCHSVSMKDQSLPVNLILGSALSAKSLNDATCTSTVITMMLLWISKIQCGRGLLLMARSIKEISSVASASQIDNLSREFSLLIDASPSISAAEKSQAQDLMSAIAVQ